MARQLEMLTLASRERDKSVPDARLVYECLDIHRLMVDRGIKGKAMRWIEGRLLRRCHTLIVSSMAFVHAHFLANYTSLPDILLLENKMLVQELGGPGAIDDARKSERSTRPPWRIGWFGVIRCRESLKILTAAARAEPDKVEVIIRGRVARNVLPDFDELISGIPNVHFQGPYNRATDLATIYHDVHFSWAVDFYEAGGNSDWLLPNRLYEGGIFGAIPIAREGCETANWLKDHDAGIILHGEPGAAVENMIQQMNTDTYLYHMNRLNQLPNTTFVHDSSAWRQMAAAFAPPRDTQASVPESPSG